MHYPLPDLSDFAFILAFFVLPALFSPVSGSITIPTVENIPWLTVLLYSLLVAYMAFRYHTDVKCHTGVSFRLVKSRASSGFRAKAAYVILTICCYMLLILTDTLFSFLATQSGAQNAVPSVSVTAQNTADTLFLVFWTALLASFEEFTYRYLLPVRLRSFVSYCATCTRFRSVWLFICEAAVICLFALSHRYMGWWAVANALTAGIILRSGFFITGSVYPALIAHILYNLTAFYGILKS